MTTSKKINLTNVPISDLIMYENNPRKNNNAVSKVAASIKEFGFVKNSVVVDENMVLITGHTTTKALKSLGYKHCPDVTQVFGLTDAQKKAYRIADNKLGELAEWDDELFNIELKELENMDFDISLIGCEQTESTLNDESAPYSLDDFIFNGPDDPCWFVIRADQENYDELYDDLIKVIKKYNCRMETSNEDSE